jgi:streptomycin 6-kinase
VHPEEGFAHRVHGDVHDGNVLVDAAGRVRVVDPKVVPGDLCVDAAYMAVMLRGADGVGVGRAGEVVDAASGRRWGRRGRLVAWVRWFAATRALSWLANGSATATEVRRAVVLALG